MEQKTNRVRIAYDLEFATLFHCGTGIREGLVDRTVVRDNRGYLYVPGSTFKGFLRERCEQLARFYEPDPQANDTIASPHNEKASLQGLGNVRPTLVTRIFGSHTIPGRLFFDDAHQDDKALLLYDGQRGDENDKGKYKTLQVDTYTQVRMDRLTRTSVPGALYTSEFGTRDIVFKGVVQGWLNCFAIDPASRPVFAQAQQDNYTPTYSLLLLLAGLQLIERLGGNKSTGKGKCQCRITNVELDGRDCSELRWSSWLEELDVLADYYDSKLEGQL